MCALFLNESDNEDDFLPQFNLNPSVFSNTRYSLIKEPDSENAWKFALRNKPRCFVIFRPSDNGTETMFIENFQCFPKEPGKQGIKTLTRLVHYVRQVHPELEMLELDASPYSEAVAKNGEINREVGTAEDLHKLIKYYRNIGFEITDDELREIYDNPDTIWDDDLIDDFYEVNMTAPVNLFMAQHADAQLLYGGKKTKRRRRKRRATQRK